MCGKSLGRLLGTASLMSNLPTLLLPKSAWIRSSVWWDLDCLTLAGTGFEAQVPALNVSILTMIWPDFSRGKGLPGGFNPDGFSSCQKWD